MLDRLNMRHGGDYSIALTYAAEASVSLSYAPICAMQATAKNHTKSAAAAPEVSIFGSLVG